MPSGTSSPGGSVAPGGSTMPSRSGQQLRGRPFLNRTPHALHSVRGPSGPHRHWGVEWQPQFRHVVRWALAPAGFGEDEGVWVGAEYEAVVAYGAGR